MNGARASASSRNDAPHGQAMSPTVDSPGYLYGPGEDVPVDDNDDLMVVQAIRQFWTEAETARKTRIKQNTVNWYAYMGQQDWSGKVKGQSREYIPKTSIAVEQVAAFIHKALVAFGDWFQVVIPDPIKDKVPLTGGQISDILKFYINHLPDGENNTTTFDIRLSDAIKVGLLQSLMIFKVHGISKLERRHHMEEGDVSISPITNRVTKGPPHLSVEERERWHLQIDLIRGEDYYPDPSGEGLYEIHKVERDLHKIIELAEQGIYDKEAVDQLVNSYEREAQERRKDSDRGQERATPPSFRKKVVLMEFWGTLLNAEGRVAHKNCVATVANNLYLIRKPEPNPFWHGESPFVVCPLTRVPFSVWHKAVYDGASGLNFALNELFNLIIDGGISAVWGIKEITPEWLENPEEVSGGIAQGATIAVKAEKPANEPALRVSQTGNVPQDAMAVYEAINREFNLASFTNDLRLGQMPSKNVKATEVMQGQQGNSDIIDAVASLVEQQCIEKILRKSWLCILQDADQLLSEDLVSAIGAMSAVTFRKMTPEQRFAAFAPYSSIKVNGLTAVLQKMQGFQKFAALMQIVMNNPLLLQAFMKKFSGDKAVEFLMRCLNINPEDIEMSSEEQAQAEQTMQRTQQASNLINGPGPGGPQGNAPGRVGGGQATGKVSNTGNAGPQVPSEINQLTGPTTGMAGNA
ncbi:MAG: hypothetical protein C5B59_17215 [Bacteroidetes bacterium]|nr:MAG: hypothetical protein C5B59_17215 [Bacteroidota bacterium]